MAASAKPDTIKRLSDLGINFLAGNPVYVVDGKEVDDIKSINPNNIESISVLKEECWFSAIWKKGQGRRNYS